MMMTTTAISAGDHLLYGVTNDLGRMESMYLVDTCEMIRKNPATSSTEITASVRSPFAAFSRVKKYEAIPNSSET